MSVNGVLASVVVPSYNHRKYLSETLASVETQTHDCIELIAVDDGSVDGSDRHLRRWAASPSAKSRFQDIKLRCREYNRGAHHALNEAISTASGDYIFVLNSDDRYDPARVKRLLEVLVAGESSLVFSRVRFVNDAGMPLPAQAWHSHEAEIDWIKQELPTVGFGFLHYQWAISTGNLAFTRELFDEVGGFVDLAYCHDWDFVLRALLVTEPVFVDQCLYDYRLHGSNTFAQLTNRAGAETRAVIERFWTASMLRRATNPLAPTPYNWPEIFHVLTARLNSSEILGQLAQQRPRYVTRRMPADGRQPGPVG